ncbi:hypothetical protein [Streptomyces sp. NPDC002952]|uniref:hypothetical protein n=1 Tax=Streptomyces sp. NPDC002952 TaxID=3364673 RepID=UPI0036CBFAFE
MDSVAALMGRWLSARAALAAIEHAEHPDIVDHHGRVWTWWKGTLYRHCGLAWPRVFIEDTGHGLPTMSALTNPNYPKFCDVCLDGRTQAAFHASTN